MQVVIFGATGSLGSHIVNEALSKGFSVKAFTRNADKMKGINNPNLVAVQGDVNNFQDVLNAIEGTNAVLCALGDGAKGKVRAVGTDNIVKAMESLGTKRLVCQTTLGLGDSWQNLNFFWKYIMFGFLLKRAFQDHKLQEEYIRKSTLDFTIVRPGAFTNDLSRRTFLAEFDAQTKNLRLKISRADVAYFMVAQLSVDESIKKTISISN